MLVSNDNWMDAPNRQEIIDTAIAPHKDLESAVLMELSPGAYTAIVRGVNNTTGVALVEAYDLGGAVTPNWPTFPHEASSRPVTM